MDSNTVFEEAREEACWADTWWGKALGALAAVEVATSPLWGGMLGEWLADSLPWWAAPALFAALLVGLWAYVCTRR